MLGSHTWHANALLTSVRTPTDEHGPSDTNGGPVRAHRTLSGQSSHSYGQQVGVRVPSGAPVYPLVSALYPFNWFRLARVNLVTATLTAYPNSRRWLGSQSDLMPRIRQAWQTRSAEIIWFPHGLAENLLKMRLSDCGYSGEGAVDALGAKPSVSEASRLVDAARRAASGAAGFTTRLHVSLCARTVVDREGLAAVT
jgi:hypothetical protein